MEYIAGKVAASGCKYMDDIQMARAEVLAEPEGRCRSEGGFRLQGTGCGA
ncbi:MAG: hypothetical protein K6C07_07330 [Bacteroidales bacterium]|nr:hypothetical protein [Bacteroidales bacterium]